MVTFGGCIRRAAAAVGSVALAFTSLTLVPPVPAAHAADEPVWHRIHLPVQEEVSFSDACGASRAGGRCHLGNDLMGAKLHHELAAVDGVISWVRVDDGTGISGNMLSLKGDDGWFYYYIHINNDTPGTDDGANPPEYRFAPGIAAGVRVKAGQFIAYMGDSGDAEPTGPHLHFEVHQPDGTAVDPWTSLRLAQGLPAGTRCGYGTNPDPKPVKTSGAGYWVLGADGGVFSFGGAQFFGSTGGIRLNKPVTGMAATPAAQGYWLVASDGGIFAFGDARFSGSAGALKLASPVVGMAATPTGKGYWLVAADGGIFAYGDAQFYGSTGGTKLVSPIVGMTSSPTGKGYWLVAADGGIFAYGDAPFRGSAGNLKLSAPIVGMAPAKGGLGYWLLAADGGVFAFGSTAFMGSLPGTGLCKWPKGRRIAATTTGAGYWIAGDDGSVTNFGDGRAFGGLPSVNVAPNGAIVGLAIAAK
jgi:hypothetical protein